MTLADLIADPFADKRYIAEIGAYNISGTAAVTIRVSDHGLVTGASDSPAHTLYEARIIEPMNFARSMFTSGRIGGLSRANFGELVLNNADGGLDAMAGYSFDGRTITIKVGAATDAFSAYSTIFTGTADAIEFSDTIVRVRLRDRQLLFTTLVQGTLYGGTGGTDGGADLKGKPKPLCFGECKNISPIRVDATNAIYQVHDGQIEAISAVYDNGATVDAADYTNDLTNGRFTLDTASTGQITCDVQGSKTGGTYVASVANIIERVVKDFGGLVSGDLVSASFTALESANSSVVGIYLNAPTRIQPVLDALANSVGAFYGFTRAGKFQVGQVAAPASSADASYDDTEILEIARVPTAIPPYRTVVRHTLNNTVQPSDRLASGVTAARRAFLEQAWREEVSTDTAVQTKHLEAGVLDVDTLMVSTSNAATEATRLQALYGTERDVYKVKLKIQPFARDLNDTVEVKFPRYSLDAGKKFRVVGLTENAARNEVDLELWG